MLSIGSYQLENNLLLAPMAGVTDAPFRHLCRHFGAAMATGEMVTADTRLWDSRKTRSRLPDLSEAEPRSIQIAGTDPEQLATAAQLSVARGAQIVDINMGCPAKKVCNKAAGSALLRDPQQVQKILENVVASVNVPVTLKFRTGWSDTSRNAVMIARMAEDSGIAALALHGRSRENAYRGKAEYETIRQVKQAVEIPVIANGDVSTPEDVRFILDYTQADALMIGRSAWGQPWIFEELSEFSTIRKTARSSDITCRTQVIINHIRAIHDFYGSEAGVRIARKHIGWYIDRLFTCPDTQKLHKKRMFGINYSYQQLTALSEIFSDMNKPALC